MGTSSSGSSFDKCAFADGVLKRAQAGRASIRLNGVEIDPVLARELEWCGSDTRYGVTFVARPSSAVKGYVEHIQDHLKRYEQDQYFYPHNDLHLTVLEICHTRPLAETSRLVQRLRPDLAELTSGLPTARIETPILVFDPTACALSFIPLDGSLAEMRLCLLKRLRRLGVEVDPRYLPNSAHVTILRYIRPLSTDIGQWLQALEAAPAASDLRWTIEEIWLTWGATYYGMEGRLRQYGPLLLHRSGHNTERDARW